MTLNRDTRVRLSRHAALKRRFGTVILVLPERALRIGGSGGEILSMCSTPRTPDQILAALTPHSSETPAIERDVLAFLDEMLALGGLVRSDRPQPTTDERSA